MRNLIFLLFISTACHGQPKEFDASQVAEDINYLRSELETFHPGLYRYTSKTKMDQFFQEAQRAATGLNGPELYARVTVLLSQVKCGHTRTSMPTQMRSTHHTESRFLPFHIELLGDKPYVVTSLGKQLPEGSKLISINGQPYQEIESLIFSHLASDGYIESGKQRMISLFFPYYYQLYVNSENDPVQMKYETEMDETRTISISRVLNVELETITRIQNSNAELKLDHFADHSYMRISTFGQQALANNGLNYERFLKQSFKEIRSKGSENLILDLRGNGGGRDNYGALLVSYLLPQEFGYFDNILVTPDYSGYGEVIQSGKKYFMTSHRGLSRWQPQEDVYKGSLYILIDGRSFSTCADVATVLHHNGRGTFLGAETGGGYDGNTSGNTRTISLPNSGITVYVPMWKYTTANVGHEFHGRGVIPDYIITRTWEQFSNEEDATLEKALELIGK